MCKKAPPPPPANPGIAAAASQAQDVGQQQLDFAKSQGEKQAALGTQYIAATTPQAAAQTALGSDAKTTLTNLGQGQAAIGTDALASSKDLGATQAAVGQQALTSAQNLGTQQNQVGQAALASAQSLGNTQGALGDQYLSFALNNFQENEALQKNLQAVSKQVQDSFLQMGGEDRARWQTVFKPLEDQYVNDAQNADSADKLSEAAGKARADVQQNAEIQRGADERRMESMGVNPASGRFAGVDRAIGLGTALGSVDAENKARDVLRDRAIGMRRDAIGLGTNLSTQASNELTGAANVSTLPVQAQLAGTQIANQGFQGAQTGAAQQAATTQAGYNTAQTGAAQQAATTAQGYGQAQTGAAQNAATVAQGYGQAQTGAAQQAATTAQGVTADQTALRDAAATTGAGYNVAMNGLTGQAATTQAGANSAITANQGAASALNTSDATQMQGYKIKTDADAAAAAGTGKLIGSVIGLGGAALTGGASLGLTGLGGAGAGTIGSILSTDTNNGPIASPFADGGSTPKDKPILVGERGPELMVPETDSVIIPNEVMEAAEEKRSAKLGGQPAGADVPLPRPRRQPFPWVDGDPNQTAADRVHNSVLGGRNSGTDAGGSPAIWEHIGRAIADRIIGLGDAMQPAAAARAIGLGNNKSRPVAAAAD